MNYITKKITFFIALLFIASFGNQATATLLNSVQTTPGKAYLWNVMYESDDDSDEEDSELDDSTDEDYVELAEVEHYSQSDEFKLPKVTGSIKRTEFNQKIILLHLNSLEKDIDRFYNSPSAGNLKTLLSAIADIANKAYNETRVGSRIGTYKHKLCKDFMLEIKSKHHGFSKVRPEYFLQYGSTNHKGARFDVIWFVDNDAYVFDYKFGDESNQTTTKKNQYYDKVLTHYKYNMKGNVRDIHP
jgi:hypothetical protein